MIYEVDWDRGTENAWDDYRERFLEGEWTMGVRATETEGKVALFDSTTGLAFGPTFASSVEAEAFLEHLTSTGERDPRIIPAAELSELAREFLEEWEAAA